MVAIGETGLDYFHGKGDLEWQRERFRRHIRAARESSKPLIIHSRDAREDTIRIMREEGAAEIGGVMHCFTEDWRWRSRPWISISTSPFPGSSPSVMPIRSRMWRARTPLERMLVETDSPYLTPVPYRGKSNQPAYVRYVAEHIAELRGRALETIARATTRAISLNYSKAPWR